MKNVIVITESNDTIRGTVFFTLNTKNFASVAEAVEYFGFDGENDLVEIVLEPASDINA